MQTIIASYHSQYALQRAYFKAYHFAAKAHGDQLYPGTQSSYIMHLSFVSMEILHALHYHQSQHTQHTHFGSLAIQCALLHDVLEDTEMSADVLQKEFGSDITQGVMALSKNLMLPKSEQMLDSLQRIRQQSHEVWMVKLADRISNLQAPPNYWTLDKCQRYKAEAETILDHLGDACPYLSQRLSYQIECYPTFYPT
jgi:(p)ppGpp synthase/HD superfamily hydrolase